MPKINPSIFQSLDVVKNGKEIAKDSVRVAWELRAEVDGLTLESYKLYFVKCCNT